MKQLNNAIAQIHRSWQAWLYEAQTLLRWWEEFLNYFNEGFTSAVIEGLNNDNAIWGTIRRAFGYHVFEYFRLHVLIEHGNLPYPLSQI